MPIRKRIGLVKPKPTKIGGVSKPVLIKKKKVGTTIEHDVNEPSKEDQVVANVTAAFLWKYLSLKDKPMTYGMRVDKAMRHALYPPSGRQVLTNKQIKEAQYFVGKDIKTY